MDMAKRVIRDISPKEKRSIRNITRSDSREREEETQEHAPTAPRSEGGRVPPRRPRRMRRPDGGDGHGRYLWWALALGGVIVVLFALSTVFSGATIHISPTQATVALDDAFTAQSDPAEGELGYEHIVVEGEVSEEITATGEEEVERKASGKLTIYNTYSSRDQRLIPNTRFESPEGNIYRIRDSVLVPGTTVEQGEVVPGQVTVTVYADQPGEAYNIGLTDFTIPGFQGDPRYEDFYARSETEMTGGFSGTINTVDDATASQTRERLQENLTDQLLEKVYAQVPEDFILYQDATFIEYQESELPKEAQGDSVTFTISGTLRGIIFSREELSTYIAREVLSNYEGTPVIIRDLDELSFSIQNRSAISNPLDLTQLTFLISGTAHLEWIVDEHQLREELRGVDRDTFPEIVKGYPAIKRAEASLMPFWASTFPESPSDISIDITHITTEGS